MTNLHNIVVYIKDEAMLQEAREILERYGEKICHDTYVLDCDWDALQLHSDNTWGLNLNFNELQEITLTELEQKLKQNRDDKDK